MRLELDVDGYGGRGMLTLIADYFEHVCAARRHDVGLDFVSDYLKNRKLRIPLYRRVRINESADPIQSLESAHEELDDPSEETDHVTEEDQNCRQAAEDSRRVFGLLCERTQRLDRLYPFEAHRGRLRRRAKTVTAYDVVLSLSLRHACLRDKNVPDEFEAFAGRCLVASGHRVVRLGAASKAETGTRSVRFKAMYERAVRELSLRRNANASVPEHVFDEGTDLLARLPPMDQRAGCRTTLVQATVGKADSWDKKLVQPKVGNWIEILGDPIEPNVSLAIPHHVEDDQLAELVRNGHGGTVLDRLRLVAHKPTVKRSERKMVQGFWKAGVEV